jgi:hypothetical protein
LLALIACVGACAAAPAGASAQSGATVLICEATGNPAAPYVEIRVSQADLANSSAGEGDIIPAPASGCPGANGATAPVETGAATTTSTSSSTATSSATTSSPAPAPAVHHRRHRSATSGVAGTSTNSLSATNPLVSETTSASSTETATEAAVPITTLPHTGGQVPLTFGLGLAALWSAAMLSLALARSRRRHHPRRR